jgi:hypothetical protein
MRQCRFALSVGGVLPLTAASWAILTAVSTSKLPPDIGASLIASLAQIARITEIAEFERRLGAGLG